VLWSRRGAIARPALSRRGPPRFCCWGRRSLVSGPEAAEFLFLGGPARVLFSRAGGIRTFRVTRAGGVLLSARERRTFCFWAGVMWLVPFGRGGAAGRRVPWTEAGDEDTILCMYVYMYIYICMCVYIHTHIYIYTYIYMYVCMHIYIYVYIYIYMYMYIR